MKTAKEITDDLITQAQRMREFLVNVHVGDNWTPKGVVPFDMTIKSNIATIRVIAETHEAAERQVSEYMDTQ